MATFPNGWTRYAPLTVGTVSGTQTNFPAMVIWNGTSGTPGLPAEIYNASTTGPLSTGADIRFSSDVFGMTQLAFEIVTYSQNSTVSNARVEIWVEIPSLASSTKFYIWWGNSSATALSVTDTYGRNAVWSNGYIGVFHLHENSGTVATNSVGTGGDGTYNGTSFPNRTDSSYGYTQTFVNANANYVALTGVAPWQITSNLTLSAIISDTSFTSAWQAIIAKGDNAYRTARNGSNNYLSFDKNNGIAAVNTTSVVSGFHHITGTFDPAVGSYMYVDGTAGTLNADTTAIASTADVLCIGRNTAFTPTRDWNGTIGEAKISNVTRSSSWVATEYNTSINFSSFMSSGDATSFPGMADIASDLDLWWKFDESSSGTIGSNAILDFSGNANRGSGNGSPTWTAGKIGRGALNLVSASSQFVSDTTLVGIPNVQAAQTFSAWINCSTIGSIMDVVTDTNFSQGNQFRITTGGFLEVSKWGGGIVATATTQPLSATTWYFIAWTYDGSGNSALYVNGVPCTLTNVSAAQSGTPSVVTAGSFGGPGNSGEYFNGRIDSVRIYSRCLNYNDILQLYSFNSINDQGFFLAA